MHGELTRTQSSVQKKISLLSAQNGPNVKPRNGATMAQITASMSTSRKTTANQSISHVSLAWGRKRFV
jgi:hypothetical protein